MLRMTVSGDPWGFDKRRSQWPTADWYDWCVVVCFSAATVVWRRAARGSPLPAPGLGDSATLSEARLDRVCPDTRSGERALPLPRLRIGLRSA